MSDLSIVQALFDTKPMGEAFNWPVDIERFVQACRELRHLCQDDDSPAEEIAKQWRKATAAIGVEGMAALLQERGEWQRIAYENAASRKPWREHDDYVVVWDQPSGCVVATVEEHGDNIAAIKFDVRKGV